MKPLILSLLLALCMTGANAQNLVQNWATKSQDYGVQDPGTVTLTVQGTNNYYYFYSISVTSTSQNQSPFDAFKTFLPMQTIKANPETETCTSDIADTVAAISKLTAPSRDPKTQVFISIPLATTQQEWTTNIAPAYNKAVDLCTPDEKKDPKFVAIKAVHDTLGVDSNASVPSVNANLDVKACRNYVVTVSELYGGELTAAKSLTATFSTTCDRITFSGGPLFTEIGNPTYVSRPAPGSTSQFLSVENTGQFRPTITGLVNINMPWHCTKAVLDPFRLGFSTGPVFQNAQSGGSSFGWLVGSSVSVYKYVYITAGAHWGNFPDTPFGFQANQVIPPNFGTLTPNFRQTVRFALGITLKTTDISKVFSGGNTQPTGSVTPNPPAAVPPAPKK